MRMIIGYKVSIVLVAVFVALDQISKYWVTTTLPFHSQVNFIPYLSWYHTHNEGVAFSLFASLNDWVLVALTVALIAFVLWLWRSTPPTKFWSNLGFAFVTGGALGNLIDRAILGYVVDFIQVHTTNWSFAIFNIADMFINVGAALIILDELFGERWVKASKDKINKQ